MHLELLRVPSPPAHRGAPGQRQLDPRVRVEHTDRNLDGLYNRSRLVADLNATLAGATAADPLLLILCYLNGFKTYNDTFGHPAGDALLARLGAALNRELAGEGARTGWGAANCRRRSGRIASDRGLVRGV